MLQQKLKSRGGLTCSLKWVRTCYSKILQIEMYCLWKEEENLSKKAQAKEIHNCQNDCIRHAYRVLHLQGKGWQSRCLQNTEKQKWMITYVYTYKRGVDNASKDHQIKLSNAKTQKDGKQKPINGMTRTNSSSLIITLNIHTEIPNKEV